MKLPLKHPLNFGKTQVTKLTFRDHTCAADYLAFDQRGGVAQRIALIASLTGTDEALIRQLHGADYRAAEAVADAMILADDDERTGDDAGGSQAGADAHEAPSAVLEKKLRA